MSIPLFTKVPSSLSPGTFAADMDQLLSELNPWTTALNDVGNQFALGMLSTSTDTETIGLGLKTLTVSAGKGYGPGMDLVVASSSSPSNRMVGTVYTYDSETGLLEIDIYNPIGLGTFASWSISLTSAVDTENFVTATGTQTLTNKTISFSSNTLTGVAPLASPTFTGTPTTPTASTGTSTTQIASTAFVQQEIQARVGNSLVAASAITAGNIIIGNSSGKAEPVSNVYNAGEVGTAVTQNSASTVYKDVISVPGTNTVIAAYSNYVVAGTVNTSDNSITFGTAVDVTYTVQSLAWHESTGQLIVLVFSGAVGYLKSLTLSGTTLSVSVTSSALTGSFSLGQVVYNAHQDKLVISRYYTTTAYGLLVYSYNGTTFTAGGSVSTTTTITSSSGGLYNVEGTPYVLLYVIISSVKYVYVYEINGVSTPTARSSATITGSFNGGNVKFVNDIPGGRILAAYFVAGTSVSMSFAILTLTGSTITYVGVSNPAANPNGYLFSIDYDSVLGSVILLGRSYTSGYITAATISGTGNTVSIGEITYVYSSGVDAALFTHSAYSSRHVVFYQDLSNSSYGRAKVLNMNFQTSTADSWIGVAENTAAKDQVCNYKTIGEVTDKLSGLVAGNTYYLLNSGALSTSGSRKFGKALSTTKLLITGDA